MAPKVRSWARLSWPRYFSRKAGPKRRTMSATSSLLEGAMSAPLLSSGLGRTLLVLGTGVQPVQRTDHSAQRPAADMNVNHRGLEAAVPQEFLDVAQIGTAIEQMSSEAMSKNMRGDPLTNARRP